MPPRLAPFSLRKHACVHTFLLDGGSVYSPHLLQTKEREEERGSGRERKPPQEEQIDKYVSEEGSASEEKGDSSVREIAFRCLSSTPPFLPTPSAGLKVPFSSSSLSVFCSSRWPLIDFAALTGRGLAIASFRIARGPRRFTCPGVSWDCRASSAISF